MALLETPLPSNLELDHELDHELDEGAARTSLRRQIERLERRLSAAALELWESQHREALPAGSASAQGARLLTVGELEAVRDSLVAQVAARERVLERRAGAQRHARAQLEAMLADPPAHAYEVVRRADLGEPSCGAYRVLPRLGLLGMLFGWWCVKLSSGCP